MLARREGHDRFLQNTRCGSISDKILQTLLLTPKYEWISVEPTIFNQGGSADVSRVRKFASTCRGLRRVAIVCFTLFGVCDGETYLAGGEITYNHDIRPILSDKCFACHGPDDADRKADLRLDIRQDAIDAGVLEPGNADASAMIERILSDDPDLLMPPVSVDKPLSVSEKQTLQQWVDQGAAYQRHWAFEPIHDVSIPVLDDSSWCRTPLDRFVMRRLVDAGLTPSPQADRSTLIRRVYLDLIGLLPSPDQVNAFVNDNSVDAYERLIDSLLASQHYGERWGRHWLDQARYADSNGYTFDNARVMWPYRDWVIAALNDDMPFDQFTTEQLAGDLLPNPTPDQLIATGFHRNTLINEEGGTDDEQFRVESVIDRANTTGSVWLALTVGCAQCHNHKFDPISQHDYYALYAFFNSTEDKNNTGPQVVVRDAHADRIRQIDEEIASLKQSIKKQQASSTNQTVWQSLVPSEHEADSGATFELLEDQSLLASGPNAVEDVYRIRYRVDPQKIASLRLDVLPHPSLPKGGPGRAGNGNFVLADVKLADGTGNAIPLSNVALADYSQPGHHVARAVDDDPHTGWAINTNGKGNIAHWAHFTLRDAVTIDDPAELELALSFWQGTQPYTLGRFRLSVSDNIPVEDFAGAKIDSLMEEKKRLESNRVKSMVMRELSKPRPTHVLIRGDFLRPGAQVQPRPLESVHPTTKSGENLTRLDLARWIVDPSNPVTPRVVVNRVWQRYFGEGIVETVEDFGSQGAPPSHPELLDWLADQFVARGWSLKQLHRLIVTSAVYRQASTTRHDLAASDPLNKLLGRQNRLRVDAEIVRDLALTASGQLTTRIGGPSVYPPQPEGVYAFTQKKKNWRTSDGEDRYRRTMYTFFYRSSPHPLLTTFDAPRFNVTCTRRSRSNTPLQSLMVANDAGMHELAGKLAERVLTEREQRAERIQYAFRLCMCRPPDADEIAFLTGFLRDQEEKFRGAAGSDEARSDETGGAHRFAWVALARVLMNLDEFITRE